MVDAAVGRLVWAALADLGREAARDGRAEVAAHMQSALAVLPRAWKVSKGESVDALVAAAEVERVRAKRAAAKE